MKLVTIALAASFLGVAAATELENASVTATASDTPASLCGGDDDSEGCVILSGTDAYFCELNECVLTTGLRLLDDGLEGIDESLENLELTELDDDDNDDSDDVTERRNLRKKSSKKDRKHHRVGIFKKGSENDKKLRKQMRARKRAQDQLNKLALKYNKTGKRKEDKALKKTLKKKKKETVKAMKKRQDRIRQMKLREHRQERREKNRVASKSQASSMPSSSSSASTTPIV